MHLFPLDLSKMLPESAKYHKLLREEAMDELVAACDACRAPKVIPLAIEPAPVSKDSKKVQILSSHIVVLHNCNVL